MAVTVGVPGETFPGERRVALTPRACETLKKAGFEVVAEFSAGAASGFTDEEYARRGVTLCSRPEVFQKAQVIAQVRTLGANPLSGQADLALLHPGQLVIGFGEPLTAAAECAKVAATGATLFALELVPRITRAQSMDVLSSMASIAGYEAVLLAALALPKLFPMMMTAAGTIAAARVLVLGAGVAGLQAIATARRLGAVVSAYDVRAAVKEQIESLGAKFVVLDMGESAEGTGGYAKAMDEAFYRKQRELLGNVLKDQNVVITTAAVPGRRAPVLVTKEMAERMSPGSVIVDIAAERGGNCELTRAGETIAHNGVTILGPVNMASLAPQDASQMYATNLIAFLKPMVKDGALAMNYEFGLYVLMLSAFLGFELIRKVSPLLHTPLMSLTNAISAISVVGAIMISGEKDVPTLSRVLGFIAIVSATTNLVSGYMITDRMLKMFKKREPSAK
jgi:NAD(P) transhydrogenase subunit alpha